MASYRIFEHLQKIIPAETHGVRMRVANFFFDRPIEASAEEYEKMCEIEEAKVSAFGLLCANQADSSRPDPWL